MASKGTKVGKVASTPEEKAKDPLFQAKLKTRRQVVSRLKIGMFVQVGHQVRLITAVDVERGCFTSWWVDEVSKISFPEDFEQLNIMPYDAQDVAEMLFNPRLK